MRSASHPLLPALILAATCAAADPAPPAGPAPAPVVVPMEILRSRHIAVRVKLNGEGPFRLILDTGSPVMLLSRKAGRKLGLPKKAEATFAGMLTGIDSTRLDAVRIGAAETKDVPAVVMDHPTVKLLAKADGELDGIVGFCCFARFRMTLDYQASTVTLVPTGYAPADVMRKMEETLTAGAAGRRLQPRRVLVGLALDGDTPVTAAVAAGGAAEAAGLRTGDRITGLDGRWIGTAQDVRDAVAALPPGEAVAVAIERNGRKIELTLKTRCGM